MPISLLTNLPALRASRSLRENNEAYDRSVSRIASGRRITQVGEDPSGLVRASLLETNIRSNQQAQRNAGDARSLIQVAEGGLNEINNILMRLREISILAASDYINDNEREILGLETEQLRFEVDRIANTTRFLDSNLLNGQGRDFNFQIGTDNDESSRIFYSASGIDVRADTLSLSDIDLSDSDSALDSLYTIDRAIQNIQLPRAQVGAVHSRLNHISSHLQQKEEILSSDLSRVRDTDLAKEATQLLKFDIQQRAALAVLAQANVMPQIALKLIDSK